LAKPVLVGSILQPAHAGSGRGNNNNNKGNEIIGKPLLLIRFIVTVTSLLGAVIGEKFQTCLVRGLEKHSPLL